MSAKEPSILAGLSESQAKLIKRIAAGLRVPVQEVVAPNSDIASPAFAEDFRNRLVLYHALNEDALKKKTFEFAFAGASQAAGRKARVISSATHAGNDVEVDGVPFSLKTEASQAINRRALTISKLMEARWIRQCGNAGDFRKFVKEKIVAHLDKYQRIIVLRAFRTDGHYEYHLMEVPKKTLMLIDELQETHYSSRTENGSSSANVMVGGQRAFTLRLDGSVEKVTISGLDIRLCQLHASWVVPIGRPENLG